MTKKNVKKKAGKAVPKKGRSCQLLEWQAEGVRNQALAVVITIGILVVLFGSHVLRVVRVHVLGVLALFVRSLFPGSALLAVHIAALGRVIHVVHVVHAIFVFHCFHPLCTLAKVVCAGDGVLCGNFKKLIIKHLL